MSGDGFSLLWSRILDSSIWDHDAPTRVVWITMLAMKDKEGLVRSTFNGLVRNSNVSEDECRKALTSFLSPDPDSLSKVEEGRRIREVEGGWFVINHEKYQYSSEEKREYWRRVKADQRMKAALKERGPLKKSRKGTPLTGETSNLRAIERGEHGAELHDAPENQGNGLADE